jgi:hypothetical protein
VETERGESALLRFVRPSRYRDRARKYTIEVDGAPAKPRLSSLSTLEVRVDSGVHTVTVRLSRRNSAVFSVDVADRSVVSLTIAPTVLPFPLARPPLVVTNEATGAKVATTWSRVRPTGG